MKKHKHEDKTKSVELMGMSQLEMKEYGKQYVIGFKKIIILSIILSTAKIFNILNLSWFIILIPLGWYIGMSILGLIIAIPILIYRKINNDKNITNHSNRFNQNNIKKTFIGRKNKNIIWMKFKN
jgi:hypothetical protein